MLDRLRRRLALGAAMTLALASVPVLAQDGSTKKNQDIPKTTNPPSRLGDALPGVPETPSDPAPPGTKGVRVDRRRAAEQAAGKQPSQQPGAARIYGAEGVVTRIDRAGKAVTGELERFAFDPSQDWYSYVSRGATGVLDKKEDRPKTNDEIKAANLKQHEDLSSKPKVLEMVISKRTYTYAHARSADGTDQYGAATAATPDSSGSRTGLIQRVPTSADAAKNVGPRPSNFTNIKEGSFVSVRYRKVGDVNEVLNLTIIELPLNPEGAAPAVPVPAAKPPTRTTPVPRTPVGTDLPK